jgi:steroid delta-isomerase-like uncharacterized protein
MATVTVSTSRNKMLIDRFYDEFYNRRQFGVIDELFSPGYVHHLPDIPGYAMDFQDFRKRELQMVNAFPDMKRTIEDQVGENDKVVTRSIMKGTQEGNLPELPATDRKIEVRSTIIYRIEDGRIVEGWESYDSLGMMMQLNVIHKVSTLSKARFERGYFSARFFD